MADEIKLEGKMLEFVEAIEKMTVLELSQLVKALEERLGVSAAAPMMAGAGAAPAGAAPAAEEKTEFTVMLTAAGPNKINVIKEVRALAAHAHGRVGDGGRPGGNNFGGRGFCGRGGRRPRRPPGSCWCGGIRPEQVPNGCKTELWETR